MPTKYNNAKVEYDGHRFDSKKEMRRYMVLREWQRRGDIRDLCCQVRFILVHGQKKRATNGHEVKRRERSYIADFTYYDRDGHFHVEDVKGYKGGKAYELFTLKTALMLENYGIEVEEV